jgi:hypothetical protein
MRAFIRHIGVVDHNDIVHAVTFGPGINVVTGKSSTGKSALIEIFDFCFGSSDFTVPEGVITKCASIYFTVIRIQNIDLVLARHRDSTKAFIKPERDLALLEDVRALKGSYFERDYFIPLSEFNKAIGREFGLQITDAEENLTDRQYRPNHRKLPSPSIRSFSSFMLQHQNLIANKHAIFYRFDEIEKRKQAIEHFKVFVGFADQKYFVKSQELNLLMESKRKVQNQIPRATELKKRSMESLQSALEQYTSSSGHNLEIGNISLAIGNPKITLDRLYNEKVTVFSQSDEHVKMKQEAEVEQRKLVAELRRSQQKLASIKSSIEFAKSYTEKTAGISISENAEIHASECPFCHTHNSLVEQEANKLDDAIIWLNNELGRSKYLLESYEEQELKVKLELEKLLAAVESADKKIASIDKQIVELDKYKTQHEQALKAKIQVERIFENLLEKPDQELEEQLKEINKKIEVLTRFLKQNYDIEKNMKESESKICSYMADIGSRFEFEDSYQPINLHFSLDTFDLWHEFDERKVFLRSMGSGANWLYCHLTLFLALHRYFCSLGDSCSIPSILFLDQPSQVYFPSVLDAAKEFSPQEIEKKEADNRKRPIDDDIKAVTNLFSQLVKFCKETLMETGIEPQIIVTDHADNLTLDGEVQFESLVQGRRWRTHGFIDPINP